MATITLTADTDYSALTVANDDTIDCAGFILTLDVAPTETGVQVTSPGTNGRVVFDGGWNLSTWDFFAGESTTAGMIGTLPEGATIKSMTGGTIMNARGVITNNGTVITSTGGSSFQSEGIVTNNGTVTTSKTHGVITNNGTVTTADGSHAITTNNGSVTDALGDNPRAITINNGTVINAMGRISGQIAIGTNNGVVTNATGGTAFQAFGIATNNGTVKHAIGGSYGGNNAPNAINTNNGLCLRITDGTGRGVWIWRGTTCFVEGPHIDGIIPDNIKTIYSLGTLSASATIAEDADVIEVSKGKGLTGIR